MFTRDRSPSTSAHYCEWIRGWTDTCLQIYGEIAQANPQFLHQFDGATDEAPQPN